MFNLIDLTKDDVTVTVTAVADHREPAFDKNIWAWALVTVSVSWKGFRAKDIIGAISCKNEEEFRNGDIFSDMLDSALRELNLRVYVRYEDIKGLIKPDSNPPEK